MSTAAHSLRRLDALASAGGARTRDEFMEARGLLQAVRASDGAGRVERQGAAEAFDRVRRSYQAEVERRRTDPAFQGAARERAIGHPSAAIRLDPAWLAGALEACRGRLPGPRPDTALIEADFGVFGDMASAGAGDRVAAQEAAGWKARSDMPAWRIPEPIDWTADPFGDRNWVAQFHGWRPMNPYLSAYGASRDPALLRPLVPWMLAWAAYRRSLDADRHKLVDPQSGMRASGLAVVLDAIRTGRLSVPPHEAVELHDLALAQVEWLAGGHIAYMNHAYFQIIGLEVLGRVLGDEPWAGPCREHAARVFEEFLASQFTEEGIHVENSPGYHAYALGQIRRSGLDRLSARAAETVARAASTYPWFVFPDGRVAPIGDTEGTDSPTDGAEVEVLATTCGTYLGAPFWRSGYAIVRSLPEVEPGQASMLVLSGTSRTHIHSHADKLGFELFERGQPVLIDTGKYGYTRDAMRAYVESAAAHNTVGLASTEIGRLAVRLGSVRLEAPRVDGDAIVLGGSVEWTPHRYADFEFTHQREIRYVPGRGMDITDTLRSDRPQPYAGRLHLDGSIELARAGHVFTGHLRDGTAIRIECLEGDAELRVHRGSLDPVRGWQSAGYLRMVPATTIEAVCPGQDRRIAWSIRLEYPQGRDQGQDEVGTAGR